ncbi:MAG: hypothetical protein R3323_09930 [Wenzhouxiangellaceae bacterium]|nr:hypothetical protein [Wenzhouxiangellaceae bacterium]
MNASICKRCVPSTKVLRGFVAMLAWLALVLPACGMAMEQHVASDHGSDCAHCPPPPCHEPVADDCGDTDPVEKPRTVEFKPAPAPLPAPAVAIASRGPAAEPAPFAGTARAGPRTHLILSRFHE